MVVSHNIAEIRSYIKFQWNPINCRNMIQIYRIHALFASNKLINSLLNCVCLTRFIFRQYFCSKVTISMHIKCSYYSKYIHQVIDDLFSIYCSIVWLHLRQLPWAEVNICLKLQFAYYCRIMRIAMRCKIPSYPMQSCVAAMASKLLTMWSNDIIKVLSRGFGARDTINRMKVKAGHFYASTIKINLSVFRWRRKSLFQWNKNSQREEEGRRKNECSTRFTRIRMFSPLICNEQKLCKTMVV